MSFVFVLPAAARRGQGGRGSDDLSRRRDAAAVSGLQLSPKNTHKHTFHTHVFTYKLSKRSSEADEPKSVSPGQLFSQSTNPQLHSLII